MTRPGNSDNSNARHERDFDVQRSYFAQRRPIRMLPLDTPYVRRHHEEVMRRGMLAAGEHICEWGAGLGRFSRLLLASGLKVDAIELSPEQTAECRQAIGANPDFRMHCGDVGEQLEQLDGSFDAMVGYFMLHHLPELGSYFRKAFTALKPGGRMVFVEPNPWCPLFPIQITLTPGMRWAAERGIYGLTPKRLNTAARLAGFTGLSIERYGSLPRAPYNWLGRWNRERMLEPFVPRSMKPFQSIVMHKPSTVSANNMGGPA